MSATEYEVPCGLPDIVSLGIRLWGEPTKRTPGKVLFVGHGSKCVQPAPINRWFDHEANVGGGYVDLYKLNFGKLPDPPGFPIPPGMAKALGDPVAWWDYHDAAGQPIARVTRFHPPGQDKTYRQFRWGGDRWRPGMNGLELPLYHLPELLKAPDGCTVYITEGEKHADQIRAWGMLATTNAGGAKKFRPDHAAVLDRFDCVILPDNDQPGRKHADVVASALRAAGCTSIRVLNLPNYRLRAMSSIGSAPAARPLSSLRWWRPRQPIRRPSRNRKNRNRSHHLTPAMTRSPTPTSRGRNTCNGTMTARPSSISPTR
jgi:hypothetical protein